MGCVGSWRGNLIDKTCGWAWTTHDQDRWASWEWGWWEHGTEDRQRARDISCVRQDRRTPSTVLHSLKPWQIPRLLTTMVLTTRTSKVWCILPVYPLIKSTISAAGWFSIMCSESRPLNGRCPLSGRNPHNDEMRYWRNFAMRLDPDRVLNAIRDIYENELLHGDIRDGHCRQTGPRSRMPHVLPR
ncbi:hypothetical protein BKA83DRAFT_4179026 [Pisolithus microcarpus]|nr:hypothetical protein BKA83DRAFT_4179026 [Pisolithus microcarpus]